MTIAGFEKEGPPAKLVSFNFSGKPILYFNRFLRRSENIFNTAIRARQTNPA